MRYRRSETVQRSEDFQGQQYQFCKGQNNVEKIIFREEMYHETCQILSLHNFTVFELWSALQFPRYNPDKILKVEVTIARSNHGHTMTLHTYTPTNVPTKFQLDNTLWFRRYSANKIFKLKVTTAKSNVKSRSHHHTTHLHPQPMALPSFNFLHLTVSEIYPGQDFIDQDHYSKVRGQIKVRQ